LSSSTRPTIFQKNPFALELVCLHWLMLVTIFEGKSWTFGKMEEHIRSCEGWVDHESIKGTVFVLVYLVLFLSDQVVYVWTLIVEYYQQTAGPIFKWKELFLLWKFKRTFCLSTINPQDGWSPERKTSLINAIAGNRYVVLVFFQEKIQWSWIRSQGEVLQGA
jgi:hypothetical protein